MIKTKRTKGQTMIPKNRKIEQHELC